MSNSFESIYLFVIALVCFFQVVVVLNKIVVISMAVVGARVSTLFGAMKSC